MSVQTLPLAASLTNIAANSFNYQQRKSEGHEFDAVVQPLPLFFIPVWYTIFAGQTAFAWEAKSRFAPKAAVHAHAASAALGTTFALTAPKRNPLVDLTVIASLFSAAFSYRSSLRMPIGKRQKFISFTAELFTGWMTAASALTAVLSLQRLRSRPLTENQKIGLGLTAVAALTAAGAAYLIKPRWPGATVGVTWALAGAALNKENPEDVRKAAGMAGLGLMAGLAWTHYRSKCVLK